MGKLKARKNKDRAGGKRRLQDPAMCTASGSRRLLPRSRRAESEAKGKPKLGRVPMKTALTRRLVTAPASHLC